jgi:hypothetical protein
MERIPKTPVLCLFAAGEIGDFNFTFSSRLLPDAPLPPTPFPHSERRPPAVLPFKFQGGAAPYAAASSQRGRAAMTPSISLPVSSSDLDLDGSSTRDSYYFTWSGDTRIQKLNEGY